MYVPRKLQMEAEQCIEFIERYPFGLLLSQNPLQATHVPFTLHKDKEQNVFLQCHFAKANSHWHDIDGTEVLMVFSGPHAYISPSWYQQQPAVPTWNYAAVQVKAKATLLPMHANADVTEALLQKFESDNRDNEAIFQTAHLEKLNRAIVSLRLDITDIQGKAKLGQDRSEADQMGVLDALTNSQSSENMVYLDFIDTWSKQNN